MLYEDGKYYTILRAEHGEETPWTEEEYLYGKYLRKEAYSVLREFLAQEREAIGSVLKGLSAAGTEKAEKRKEELLLKKKRNEAMTEKLANK